jgi:hypothetical protein
MGSSTTLVEPEPVGGMMMLDGCAGLGEDGRKEANQNPSAMADMQTMPTQSLRSQGAASLE